MVGITRSKVILRSDLHHLPLGTSVWPFLRSLVQWHVHFQAVKAVARQLGPEGSFVEAKLCWAKHGAAQNNWKTSCGDMQDTQGWMEIIWDKVCIGLLHSMLAQHFGEILRTTLTHDSHDSSYRRFNPAAEVPIVLRWPLTIRPQGSEGHGTQLLDTGLEAPDGVAHPKPPAMHWKKRSLVAPALVESGPDLGPYAPCNMLHVYIPCMA